MAAACPELVDGCVFFRPFFVGQTKKGQPKQTCNSRSLFPSPTRTICPVQKRAILTGIGLSVLSLLLVCVILFVVAGGIQVLPIYRTEPQDILPALRTQVLMMKPNREEIMRWQQHIDVLKMVESIPDALAVVTGPDDTVYPVLFERRPPGGDARCAVGIYRVTVPGESLCVDLTTAGEAVLSDEAGFHALGREQVRSWTFVRRSALPSPETLKGRVLESLLLDASTHLRFAAQSGGMLVTLWPSPTSSSSYPNRSLPALEGMTWSIGVGDVRETIARVLKDLHPQDRITARGLLLGAADAVVGPSLSIEYGVLRALRGQGFAVGTRTASGTSAIVIGAESSTSKTATAIETLLHNAFRARQTDVEIAQFTFDGRFPFQTARIARDRIVERQSTEGSWSVKVAEDRKEPLQMATAINGSMLWYSNDETALRDVAIGGRAVALPLFRRPIALQTEIGAVLPSIWLHSSPALSLTIGSGDDRVVLSLQGNGEKGYLQMRRQ